MIPQIWSGNRWHDIISFKCRRGTKRNFPPPITQYQVWRHLFITQRTIASVSNSVTHQCSQGVGTNIITWNQTYEMCYLLTNTLNVSSNLNNKCIYCFQIFGPKLYNMLSFNSLNERKKLYEDINQFIDLFFMADILTCHSRKSTGAT